MSSTPARRPTMRDVASVAGVSLKTVSRVINREVGVRPELAQRVDDAVRLLGFRPDDRARNLRRSDSGPASIGFAMLDVANPFFSGLLRGLDDAATERGCLVLSGNSDGDPARQERIIESFIDRRVAGLVVVSCGDGLGPIHAEILRGTPVVFLDREPANHQSDVVRSDHFGGAVELTEHLIANGHTAIGFLGDDPNIFSARLRCDGFRSGMAAAQLPVHEEWCLTGHYRPDEWCSVVKAWFDQLDERPTALVCGQNFVTMGATKALHDLELQHRIALVGFDDFELSDVLRPGITVIPQWPQVLGRLAAELIFRRLDGFDGPPVRDVVATHIIQRGSGEIPGPVTNNR